MYYGFVQYNRSVVCICYLVGVYVCIVYVTWLVVCVCVYVSDRIANVYIVNGLQPNGQCEFRLQGQCGFRLQCLVLPANWAVWIWTVVFSPASQLGSVDLDCRGSVDSDCSVCLSAKWCSVDSHWLVIT